VGFVRVELVKIFDRNTIEDSFLQIKLKRMLVLFANPRTAACASLNSIGSS
jgi:hypothetical protein